MHGKGRGVTFCFEHLILVASFYIKDKVYFIKCLGLFQQNIGRGVTG